MEDYGWIGNNVKYDGIFLSKQTNENLIGLSRESDETK